MKNKVVATTLALGVGVSTAGAQYYSSDTMRELTRDIIGRCAGATLNAVGGGSSYAGSQMIAGTQETAPQSRFLSAAECNAAGPGQGIRVALDGVAVFRDDQEGSTCNVIRYNGTFPVSDLNNAATLGYGNGVAGPDDGTGAAVPATHTVSSWADVLRIVYTGQHANLPSTAAAGCGPAPAATTPATVIGTRRCNSDVRRSLLENWGNLFDNAGGGGDGGCTDAKCVRLQHAFRRDDFSGTTDVFLSLIGSPSMGTGFNVRTFCNGLENEDLDPVRRRAETAANAANDPYSVAAPLPFAKRNAPFGADGSPNGQAGSVLPTPPVAADVGDLGVVLPISLPTQQASQYDTALCTAAPVGGAFRYAPMPAALSLTAQKCPDGTARSSGQCRWPVNAAGRFNCRAKRANRPGGIVWANFDGRSYNLVPRDPASGAILQPNAAAIQDPRWGGGGHYRIHMSFPAPSQTATPFAVAHAPCTETDATNQIGCLVKASPCSIGYAGLEARATGNRSFLLEAPVAGRGEQDDVEANILRVLEPTGAACEAGGTYGSRYPFSRILYFNSVKGFDNPNNAAAVTFSNITGAAEKALAQCYTDRALVEAVSADAPAGLIRKRGFIPLPASQTTRESRVSANNVCAP